MSKGFSFHLGLTLCITMPYTLNMSYPSGRSTNRHTLH